METMNRCLKIIITSTQTSKHHVTKHTKQPYKKTHTHSPSLRFEETIHSHLKTYLQHIKTYLIHAKKHILHVIKHTSHTPLDTNTLFLLLLLPQTHSEALCTKGRKVPTYS